MSLTDPSTASDKKEKPENVSSSSQIDPNSAQDRSLNVEPPPDQLAVESSQVYHAKSAPYPELIPVPLPLPVHPGSIVLPDLPNNAPPPGYGKKSRDGGAGSVGTHVETHNIGSSNQRVSSGYKPNAPPPVVYKQPRTPLTRSSNPSPVSHFSKTEGEGVNYQPPLPPPPPPNLPQQNYAPPRADIPILPTNYVPPPLPPSTLGEEYNPPPSNDLSPDNYNGPNPTVQLHHPPPAPEEEYGQPKANDLYEGRQPILNHGTSDLATSHSQVAHLDEIPINSYQAPHQPSISLPDYQVSGSELSNSAYLPPASLIQDDLWLSSSGSDMPQITDINVKCEKNLMRVTIHFDRPFYGIIFSKGHYSNVHCVHLPASLGKTVSTFDISINSCGTTGNADNGYYGHENQGGYGTYFENTLVIQYDPQVQEVWDQARKLRCTWHDQYEKSVTFKPFPVDMLDVVRADFAGDNVGCWMQIQVGKGPWASEVSGLVKIGQAMTMVLAIKDEDNKFDMLVRNCMAHDGKRAPIQLVDQRGCVTRPKLMSKFTKIKNFGASASVLSYAHFQAFKFPDSMEVHFQCTIQICRYQCPEQCADSAAYQQPGTAYDVPAGVGQPRDNHRRKRETNDTKSDGEKDIGVNRIIQVVSTRDLSFLLDKKELLKEIKETDKETLIASVTEDSLGLICMSTPGFVATLVVLLSILVISCLLSAFLCLRLRGNADTQSIMSSMTSYQNPAFLHKKRFF